MYGFIFFLKKGTTPLFIKKHFFGVAEQGSLIPTGGLLNWYQFSGGQFLSKL